MDFEVFVTCLQLYFESVGCTEKSIRKPVAEVFGDIKNIPTKDRPELRKACHSVDGFGRIVPDIDDLFKKFKQGNGHVDHGFAMLYLTQPGCPYHWLQAQLERQVFDDATSFGEVVQNFETEALIRLGRLQPRLREAEQDFTYENLILHYAYDQQDKIEVLGRSKQQAELRAFLKDERPFLWVQLAGAAGQGKSRLAFDLIREAKEWLGYDAGYMSSNDLAAFSEQWQNWHPHKPHLIVIDYVHEPGKVIGPPMALLAHRCDELKHRIRFLLLERQRWDRGGIRKYVSKQHQAGHFQGQNSRQGAVESDFELSNGRASWFEKLETDKQQLIAKQPRYSSFVKINLAHPDYRFGANGLIELEALKPDELCDLVRQVASRESPDCAVPQSDKIIKDAVARFDSSGRPLYAYFLGIVLADGSFEAGWKRTELLNRILEVYRRRRWASEFDGSPPKLHSANTGVHLAVAAIIVRAITFQSLNTWPLESVSVGIDGRSALVLVGAPLGGGFGGLGSTIPGLLPDLLGEWFVISVLEAQANTIAPILGWCWGYEPEGTRAFLQRILQDFPDHAVVDTLCSFEPKSATAKVEYATLTKNQMVSKWHTKGVLDEKDIFLTKRASELGNISARSLLSQIEYQSSYNNKSSSKQGLSLSDQGSNFALNGRTFNHLRQPERRCLSRETDETEAPNDAWLDDGETNSRLRNTQNLSSTRAIVALSISSWLKSRGTLIKLSDKLERFAANEGHPQTLFLMGTDIEVKSENKYPDVLSAIKLYEKAASSGHVGALFALARLLDKGEDNAAPNPKAANEAYLKGVGFGHLGSMYCLASNLQKGRGVVAPEISEANDLFCKAARLGDVPSMTKLGENLQRGYGFRRPAPRYANSLVLDAAKRGSAYSARALGLNCERGVGFCRPNARQVAALFHFADELDKIYLS
ncbi:MAG: tetratricopeptide repeat protein [Thalassovita sp.]